MNKQSKISLSDIDLRRLDAGAMEIARIWPELTSKGFNLVESFFEFLEKLNVDDIEIEPRRFYFSERAREILTLQHTDWNPKNRKFNNLYYRSAYLDWIDAQFESSLFSYAVGGRVAVPVDPAYARFLELSRATSGPDFVAYKGKIDQWMQQRSDEASHLVAQRPEVGALDLKKIGSIKSLMQVAFHGSGFSYDSERSNKGLISYSRRVSDTDMFFVCTFQGVSKFDTDWPWMNAILREDNKNPVTNSKHAASLFPILFDIDDIIPNSRFYLRHIQDVSVMKLGCFFYAAALASIADKFDENPGQDQANGVL